ncbi:PAS domain-containing sensor histidine kinase [Yunchengibacter salinarum]|uniref:PAS domain-containing sensor histidine kinase n=1 Tax=Yunchengibacter salinarum TaxID=3133399 RepID=UPI0035B610F8
MHDTLTIDPNRALARLAVMSPDAIIITDCRGHITLFNLGAEKIFGWRLEDIVGKPVTRLMPDSAAAVHDAHMAGFARSSETARFMNQRRPIQGKRRDGSLFLAEATIVQLPLNDDPHFGVILRDVTEREESRRRLEHALNAATVADRTKSEFLHRVNHEFKTPLNAIIGFAEVLQTHTNLDETNRRAYLDYVLHSARDMQSLVEDVITISDALAENSSGHLREDWVPVSPLMERAIQAHKSAAEEAGVTLSFDSPGDVDLYCDARRTSRALSALVDNAIRFSPPEGVVRLSTSREADGSLNLTVTDEGSGMDQETRQQAHQPFFQADSGLDRRYNGLGLGLTIADMIMKQHSGRCQLDSAPGKGTKATLTFSAERIHQPAPPPGNP